jgi:GPH family glycoside/pentoside/hexuronide:cation symporter
VRADSPERLSLTTLAVFSLPMVIVQTIEIAWRVYLPVLFATNLGVSLGAVGALLMAVRIWDTVIDPVIAWASDRFPTRYGHRRPWLAASVPLMMLGTAGAFFAWPWTNLASLAISCLALHLGYMMLVTPHGGWGLELARDPDERLRIMGAKVWFGTAGTIAILLLPAMLERGLGVGIQGQVAGLGVLLLLLCPLIVFLVLCFVPEPELGRDRSAELANPLRLFSGILRTRALHPILLLYLFAGLAQSASAAAFLFFIEGPLGLGGWGSSLLVLQTAAMLATMPLWSKVGVKIGRRRLLMLHYGWQLVTAPLALLLPAGMIAPAIGFLLLRSLLAGVDFLVLRAMVADIARDSAEMGLCHGASCYSVSNITLRLAMGGGAWIALSLVAMASGDGAAAAGDSGQAAGIVIRAAYALPSVVASGLGLLVLVIGFRPASRTKVAREGKFEISPVQSSLRLSGSASRN